MHFALTHFNPSLCILLLDLPDYDLLQGGHCGPRFFHVSFQANNATFEGATSAMATCFEQRGLREAISRHLILQKLNVAFDFGHFCFQCCCGNLQCLVVAVCSQQVGILCQETCAAPFCILYLLQESPM